MSYYVKRKLISWLAPDEIHDLVIVIARREDRSLSNYLKRLILKDLRDRSLVDEDGNVLRSAQDLQETVAQ